MALEFSTSKKVYDQLYGRIKIITKPSHVIMSQRRNDKKIMEEVIQLKLNLDQTK